MISLGFQCSVFHGSNSLNHHSSLQRQKENCSRGVHGHIQISSDEEAYVDSSAHIIVLNNEDSKKPWFLQIINNKIKIIKQLYTNYMLTCFALSFAVKFVRRCDLVFSVEKTADHFSTNLSTRDVFFFKCYERSYILSSK